MKAEFKYIIFVLALLATWSATALDLPVKRISGIDYYCYEVDRPETASEIAKKLGITYDDLLRCNPAATKSIRIGSTLFFPVHEFPEDNQNLPGQTSSTAGIDSPTRYRVSKGETLYGISRNFDVTPDDIVELNPSAKNGVRDGQMILIPHADARTNIVHPASNPPTAPRPTVSAPVQPEPSPEPSGAPLQAAVVPPTEQPLAESPQTSSVDQPSLAPAEPIATSEIDDEREQPGVDTITPGSIALILPLMLDSPDTENKNSRTANEFVRGFMLGVKSLSDRSYPCTINVYDSKGSTEQIEQLLTLPEVASADVLIAHDDAAKAALFGPFSIENEVYSLNLFAAHDSTYLTNHFFMQANIPAQLMYEKAADALMRAFEGYTPVFLASKGGRGEKVPFTNYLSQRYQQQGIVPIEIVFDGMFTSIDTDAFSDDKRYVFIPVSGSLSEFNKFSGTLLTMRQNADDPSRFALVGYPDWTTFRGEALETLHRLNATIYSRFYCNDTSLSINKFNQTFEQTYGSRPLEQVPSQAIMGYDAARYILSNMTDNEGAFTPVMPTPFRGLQSTYMFAEINSDEPAASDESAPRAGYANTSLYIITFLPDHNVNVKVL